MSCASGVRVGTACTAFHSISDEGPVSTGGAGHERQAVHPMAPAKTIPSTTTVALPRTFGLRVNP
jgi:hypothetical protein